MCRLRGRKRPEEIPGYLAWCDAAFISFAESPLFGMTIPAKLQSYMACGMPILAAATGETRRIVREARCGACCDVGDGQALAGIITEMAHAGPERLSDMSRNALGYCREHFGKDMLMARMEEMLAE